MKMHLASTVIICFLYSSTSIAFFQVHYQCLNECTNSGYEYVFCKSKCSSKQNSNTINQVDRRCENNCIKDGHMRSYCKQACSY